LSSRIVIALRTFNSTESTHGLYGTATTGGFAVAAVGDLLAALNGGLSASTRRMVLHKLTTKRTGKYATRKSLIMRAVRGVPPTGGGGVSSMWVT
jgi:hypothetical protein